LKKTNDLKEFQGISFDGLNSIELEQFIKRCDNRLEMSKTFLKVSIFLIGFTFTVLSLLVPKTNENIPLFASIFIIFLLVLYIPYNRYILNIKGWTAFKEKALMEYPDKK
jgi:uncharacterized membrane protein